MNKYCLISVRPEHAFNILNGKKTRLELVKLEIESIIEEIQS